MLLVCQRHTVAKSFCDGQGLLSLKGFVPEWELHIKIDLSVLKCARLLGIPIVGGALSSTDAHVILLQRNPWGPGHPNWHGNHSENQLSKHPFLGYLGHQQMHYWAGFVPLRKNSFTLQLWNKKIWARGSKIRAWSQTCILPSESYTSAWDFPHWSASKTWLQGIPVQLEILQCILAAVSHVQLNMGRWSLIFWSLSTYRISSTNIRSQRYVQKKQRESHGTHLSRKRKTRDMQKIQCLIKNCTA